MDGLRNKALLVALGNPLSGDDGFGSRVLERLQGGAVDLPPGVSLVDAGTDLLNHIESFTGYGHVVLIDAILDPEQKLGPPGCVKALEEDSFLSWSEISHSVHQVSPLLGIKLFRTLHPGTNPRIHLVGLFVDQISHSPLYMTDERIQEAVRVVLRVLEP
jgi:hydrogenase maturation protease